MSEWINEWWMNEWTNECTLLLRPIDLKHEILDTYPTCFSLSSHSVQLLWHPPPCCSKRVYRRLQTWFSDYREYQDWGCGQHDTPWGIGCTVHHSKTTSNLLVYYNKALVYYNVYYNKPLVKHSKLLLKQYISIVNYSILPEHIVPIFLDKVHLLARNVEVGAHFTHLHPLQLHPALPPLLTLIPVAHKHTHHLPACEEEEGEE